jgi:hypothetical protein
MEKTTAFSCVVGITNPAARLGLEIWLDQTQIFNSDYLQDSVKVEYNIPDNDGECDLRFVMKNKNETHTVIDEHNNIIEDARVTISSLTFDGIDCTQIFVDQSVYTHNFNGTQEEIQEKCYGELGCNGIVSLKFTTPFYMWLLENM